jgi:hypothetical protein
MTTDPATDGTGPYPYVQSEVFYDDNPSTPSVSSVAISLFSAVTKQLSGITYFNIGTAFTVSAAGINNLNANTSRTSGNLVLSASEYGIGTLQECPFGAGAANFSGWTNDRGNVGASYSNDTFSITQANYRYSGVTANAIAYAKDSWASGLSVSTPNASVLIDTYGINATDTFEPFDDESRRLGSNYVTPWNSGNVLQAGDAMVFGGQLRVGFGDWTTYSPVSPDYSGLSSPASYFRKLLDSDGDLVSFTITFSGNFLVDATTDLTNSDLEIYVRRIDSVNGGSGTASNPLRLHGANYNFATFDDGATVGGSYIREANSAAGSVNGTFGGFAATNGIYIEVRIMNSGIRISSMEITFF